MLSNEQKQWFDSAMVDSNPAKKRALIKNPTYLWKSHTVPFVFHKSVGKIFTNTRYFTLKLDCTYCMQGAYRARLFPPLSRFFSIAGLNS